MKLTAYMCALSLTAGILGCELAVEAAGWNAFRGKTAGAAKILESESLSEEGEAKEAQKAQTKEAPAAGEEPIGELPEAEETEQLWGYTNLGIANVDNHLNVREAPGEDGKLIGKMTKDAACEILSVENNWAHIRSGKVEGYVSMDYLFTGKEARSRAKEAVTAIATVTTQTLKVREEPNTQSTVLTLVPIEEKLEVEAVEGGWVKIYLDDETAYVSADYVDIKEQLETAVTMTELLYGVGVSDVKVDLCQYAKKFIGNPYVWGGTSLTKGADCSGFVLSVFKKYGVSLPRTSREQAKRGTKVQASAIQPGDLVFYAKNKTINHVAIYVGNGQVVHASSPRTGIRISNMYYRTPYTIRRIIP